MADPYGLHPLADYPHRQSSSSAPLASHVFPAYYQTYSTTDSAHYSHRLPAFGSEHSPSVWSAASDAALMAVEIQTERVSEEESPGAIRAKIASHPLYPKLVDAFVDCQKVVFYSNL